MSSFETFVVGELPKRDPSERVATTSYDGDPNGGGAPAALQGAPAGTWYLRETPSRLWYRKKDSGPTDWEEYPAGTPASLSVITEEPLDFPIDYNDGTAVDPVSGTVFTTQTQIDDFLASNSTSNFKTIMGAWEAIPPLIDHEVTLTLASGVHRPRVGETFDGETLTAWPLRAKTTLSAGIHIVGSSTFTALSGLSSLSITGLQLASGDPYLDFAGTPFAALDLRGLLVELSTGQINVIHDHTDSRLRLTRNLTPDPTGGTCSVVRPSTILRNSFDDISPAYTQAAIKPKIGGSEVKVVAASGNNFSTTRMVIDRIRLDVFNTGFAWGIFNDFGSNISVIESLLDYTEVQATYSITPQGRPFQNQTGARMQLYRVGCRAPVGSSVDDFFSGIGSFAQLRWSVLYGGTEGINMFGPRSRLVIGASVVAEKTNYGFLLQNGVVLVAQSQSGIGFLNEFRDIGGAAIELGSGALVFDAAFHAWTAKDCAKGLVVGTGCTMEQVSSDGIKDGGGNTDVGIEFVGSGSTILTVAGTDVTGTNGDVRMADGDILTYADITANGPFFDANGNSIDKA